MTTVDFKSLANPYIRNLIPYQPGKPIEEVERELGIASVIKLASNENPLGASQHAIAAGQRALLQAHVYPDGGCYALKQALAQFLSVQPTQLTMGNGSENVLEIIVKAYLGLQDNAVISQYAFLTIPLLVRAAGATINWAKADNFMHSIPNMLAAVNEKTRILFVVNPNNPTGTYTTKDELLALLDYTPKHILVVLDEAYHEYIDSQDYPDTLGLLSSYPNLIVTRTFSKAYGLAALRLGYAVSSLEIADILNRARLPFNVNSIAAQAALAALKDQNHIKRTLDLNNEGRAYFEEQLQKLQISYIPSLGNFITIDCKQDAMLIYQQLLQEGIIVRPLVAYEMPNHIRVTIGTMEQNKLFLKIFTNRVKATRTSPIT